MSVGSLRRGDGVASATPLMKKAHVQRLIEGAAAAGFTPLSIRFCSNGDIILDRSPAADFCQEGNDDGEAFFAAWKGGAHAAAA